MPACVSHWTPRGSCVVKDEYKTAMTLCDAMIALAQFVQGE
jgi:hypothetical protein